MTEPNITETVDITIRADADAAGQMLTAIEEIIQDKDIDTSGIQQVSVTPSYVYIPPES